MQFKVYKVADLDGNDDYTLTSSFQDAKVSLDSLDRDNANTLAAYVAAQGIASLDSGFTSGGSLTFTGLADGLYLVVGASYSSGGYTYTPVPFLVRLSDSGTVTAQVKHGQTGGGDGNDSYTVVKQWKNDQGQARPSSVTIQILRNGSVQETVTLSASNHWRYTWSGSSSSRWQVVETDVPEGYTVSVSQSGQTFTVTNTFTH